MALDLALERGGSKFICWEIILGGADRTTIFALKTFPEDAWTSITSPYFRLHDTTGQFVSMRVPVSSPDEE